MIIVRLCNLSCTSFFEWYVVQSQAVFCRRIYVISYDFVRRGRRRNLEFTITSGIIDHLLHYVLCHRASANVPQAYEKYLLHIANCISSLRMVPALPLGRCFLSRTAPHLSGRCSFLLGAALHQSGRCSPQHSVVVILAMRVTKKSFVPPPPNFLTPAD